MNIDGSGLRRVSNGHGRTTCGYFIEHDQRIIYSSTFANDSCLSGRSRSVPRICLAARPVRDVFCPPGRFRPAAADQDRCVQRRDDGVARWQAPDLYLDSRRRHRSVHDGRRRQQREADHQSHRLRRWRLLLGRWPRDCVARRISGNGSRYRRLPPAAGAAPGPARGTGALDRACRWLRCAPDHAPWWRQLGPVLLCRRQADHLLVELRKSPQRKLRPVPDPYRWNGAREDSPRQPSSTDFPMFSPDGRKLVWVSSRHSRVPGEINLFIADWKE